MVRILTLRAVVYRVCLLFQTTKNATLHSEGSVEIRGSQRDLLHVVPNGRLGFALCSPIVLAGYIGGRAVYFNI